jgi:hypothetical protein
MKNIITECFRVLDNHRVFVFNIGDIFDNDNYYNDSDNPYFENQNIDHTNNFIENNNENEQKGIDFLKNVKAIGAVSTNGFVKELEYEREGYKAHAILKSSRDKSSDNLMYEFYVGIIMNRYAKKLTCFVETYGQYEYKTDAFREKFQTEKSGLEDLKNMLTPNRIFKYGESCTNSINQCILIQHIKGASSVGDKIYKGTPDFDFIINDFLYAIYQIWCSN